MSSRTSRRRWRRSATQSSPNFTSKLEHLVVACLAVCLMACLAVCQVGCLMVCQEGCPMECLMVYQEGCLMECLMEKPTLVPTVKDPQLKKSTKFDLLKIIFF